MSFVFIDPKDSANLTGIIFIKEKILIKKTESNCLDFTDVFLPLNLIETMQYNLIVQEDKNPYTRRPVIFAQCREITVPQGYKTVNLKAFLSLTQKPLLKTVSRYRALLNWICSNKFCGCCGTPNIFSQTEEALVCSNKECKNIIYPRISPAVIVLIHKDNKILLAKHKLRNQEIYTCIAGYVETGENIEECVYREINEEVGLKVKDLTYAGSQSWSFPDQLMFAFHCNWESGDIKIDNDELTEAGWFDIYNLPENISVPGSVAYNLIKGKFARSQNNLISG